ncbi:Protein SIEL [Forsythia ovata]|uniref:Protein SIEL n=1 Tax=Forsythia ovata TaxID=205694 RepID=A0ABD1TB29_9LAMI
MEMETNYVAVAAGEEMGPTRTIARSWIRKVADGGECGSSFTAFPPKPAAHGGATPLRFPSRRQPKPRLLLRNVSKFCVRPSLLLTVLLGFTKDPYPNIREVALDGLVELSSCIVVEDQSLIEGCYFRAVELLFDCEDSVRRSAVCAVSEWGRLLVACNQDQSKKEWSDTVFVQLCSMVRDMDMKLRVVAFDALGKIRMVSEDILLQTLCKKALPATKEKTYCGQLTAKLRTLPASAAAFAFVHGLEDEFHEVRRSACRSLCMLTAVSAEFASEAVNILMDMLNDDSVVVRLQALETIHFMAISDHLKVEEAHLHMFLGTLLDRSDSIRSTARNTLQLIKLRNLAMFRLGIDALMKNLEFYPQDEADLFLVIFKLGRTHGKFVGSIIREVFQELEPSFEGKLAFDNARTVALLVLAISVPVSFERRICTVPPQTFSYAVIQLGRISRGLFDVVNQDTLLAYLSYCSRFSLVSASEFFKGEEPALQLEKRNDLLCQKSNDTSEAHLTSPLLDCLANLHDRVTSCAKIVLRKISDIWRLIELGCMGEVIQTLRSWKEELSKFTSDSSQTVGVLAFALQYIHVIKLLGKVWTRILSSRNLRYHGIGVLEVLLGKIDKRLQDMWYRFIGLSREEELHLLEIMLLSCVLRLSYLETFNFEASLKKICTISSRVENLCKEEAIELSNFILDLQKLLCEIGNSSDGVFENIYLLQKSLKSFSLRQIVLSGEIKHLEAELNVRDNDFQNPLPFILGLPVGIPFEITLYNLTSEKRLWLTMTVDGTSPQFVFLDLHEFEGCDEIRKFTFVAPFYGTPRVTYFSLKVCIAMECLSEDVQLFKDYEGPKPELSFLCKEIEVHLSTPVK